MERVRLRMETTQSHTSFLNPTQEKNSYTATAPNSAQTQATAQAGANSKIGTSRHKATTAVMIRVNIRIPPEWKS